VAVNESIFRVSASVSDEVTWIVIATYEVSAICVASETCAANVTFLLAIYQYYALDLHKEKGRAIVRGRVYLDLDFDLDAARRFGDGERDPEERLRAGECERERDTDRPRFCASARSPLPLSTSSSRKSPNSSTTIENRMHPFLVSLTTKTKVRSAVTTVSASGSGTLVVSIPRAPTSINVLWIIWEIHTQSQKKKKKKKTKKEKKIRYWVRRACQMH